MVKVTISDGAVVGAESNGVCSFKGIPYAAPITGESRWLPPAPPAKWKGDRDATQYGCICPQEPPPNKWLAGKAGRVFIETLWKNEPAGDDCLNLNVWTRSLDPSARLPVMFWIHGGAFTTGSGSLPIYDGANLAKKDVVVVSINYRLGLMGCFAAPGMFDDGFCGPNRGFLDQVAALRWVRENISAFGGDPDNVTIFGESAGGQSVVTLLASPATKGLFKRAIAQSGTPEICARIADHEQFSRDLLKGMGIAPGDRAAISRLAAVDTIRAMKTARRLIAKAADDGYGELMDHGYVIAYGDEFLPRSILESLEQGEGDDVDLMIGTVMEDGRLFPLVMPGPEMLASWLCMKYFKGLFRPRAEPERVLANYRSAMPGTSDTAIRGQIMTDALFRRGTVKAAELHADHAPGRTFLYQFNWSSPVPGIGAMHGLDVAFTNQNLEAFAPILGDIEPLREMADTISDAWVHFARTGQPAASNLPDWKPFDRSERATMILDRPCELAYDVDRERREVWYG